MDSGQVRGELHRLVEGLDEGKALALLTLLRDVYAVPVGGVQATARPETTPAQLPRKRQAVGPPGEWPQSRLAAEVGCPSRCPSAWRL